MSSNVKQAKIISISLQAQYKRLFWKFDWVPKIKISIYIDVPNQSINIEMRGSTKKSNILFWSDGQRNRNVRTGGDGENKILKWSVPNSEIG